MERILLDRKRSKLLGGGENSTETTRDDTDILQTYPSVSAELHRRNLGYMWVDRAMANQADRASRSLTADSVAMRAKRYKFGPAQPHDVADAIMRLGFPVFPLGQANQGDKQESLLGLPEEGTQEALCLLRRALFVQTRSRRGLPQTIHAGKSPENGEPLPERKFILGAKFTGSISRKKGASSGYYTPTRNPKEAVIGVYRPADEANWPTYSVADATMYRKRKGRQERLPETVESRPKTAQRITDPTRPHEQPTAPQKRSKRTRETVEESVLSQRESRRDDTRTNTTPQQSRTDRPTVRVQEPSYRAETTQHNDEEKDALDALRVNHRLGLNGRGKRPTGYACPRHWMIYPDKPPHVSQLAWAAVTQAQREGHIRWLRELRQMPEDLLTLSLPEAAIELVRRAAVARGWKWTTICKALALIKGALLNLPLYTNQRESIDISRNPS
ncbi:TATE DNA Transposon [Trypanosoma theileri]|uniref:TATE DNA Transposon n=1 Tax=Trypanosoma theileri TaxID=67003 RepID=A0A1X0NZU9_9TRYP|nr:TATE DNA Transposon [Trypanosoma theileri]ORC90013.1 TATE DNA Transposon [Trypanosoma theileri]